jgi:hypothetical protein
LTVGDFDDDVDVDGGYDNDDKITLMMKTG